MAEEQAMMSVADDPPSITLIFTTIEQRDAFFEVFNKVMLTNCKKVETN